MTYNTLIDVYGKMGRWEDAVKVLSDMADQVKPLLHPHERHMPHNAHVVAPVEPMAGCQHTTVEPGRKNPRGSIWSHECGQPHDAH